MIKRMPQEWADWTGCKVTVYSNGMATLDVSGERIPIPDSLIEITDDNLDNVFFPDKPDLWKQMEENE